MDKLHSKIMEWKEKLSQQAPLEVYQHLQADDYYTLEKNRQGHSVLHANTITALYALHQIYLGVEINGRARAVWRVLIPKEVDDAFFEQAVLLGFNTVVLNSSDWVLAAKSWGLKVILEASWPKELPLLSPFKSSYNEALNKIITSYKQKAPFDALLWKSPFLYRDMREELNQHAKLKIELFLEEISALESLAPLFYHLPSQFRYTQELKRFAGPQTWLVASDPENYMSDSLPLIKGHEQESPLLIDETIRRLLLPASGAFLQVSSPIITGSFVQANLYGCSQALWSGAPPDKSFEIWASTYRPELNIPSNRSFLNQMMNYLPKMKYLETSTNVEELKMHVDIWMAEWKLFEKSIEKLRKTEQIHPQQKRFIDEVNLFFNSGKELARQALARHQITIPHALMH